jgi:hypothetical protein
MIGTNAGTNCVDSSGSNFIGFDSGRSIKNSSKSNVIGYGAGYLAENIANSNIIGNSAGNSAGYSAGNVSSSNIIGDGAGVSAGSNGGMAINLIAIGSSAGTRSANRIGANTSDSIYIGLSSGINQSGLRNIFIGGETNTSTPSAISLSGCIAIGYGAKPSARITIAIGSTTVPLSVVPGTSFISSVSGLKIMVNGTYYTIPLLA